MLLRSSQQQGGSVAIAHFFTPPSANAFEAVRFPVATSHESEQLAKEIAKQIHQREALASALAIVASKVSPRGMK